MLIHRIRRFGFFVGILAFLLLFQPILGNGYSSNITPKNFTNDSDIEKSSAYEYFIKGRNAYLLSTPMGYENAINWYKKALEVDEKYAPAYAGLGETYSFWIGSEEQGGECGASYDSLEYSLKAVQLAPNSYHSHRALATSYYSLGMNEEAKSEAMRALEMNPSDAEAYFILWKSTSKDPESEYIRKALDLNPDLPLVHNDLGTAYLASGNHEKAIYHFRRTVELSPKNAIAYNNLGYALAGKGKIEEAIKIYKKSVEIDPNNNLARSNLANALLQNGEIDKAVREYKKAVGTEPNSALFHYNLGTVLLLDGKIKEGIEELKKTIELKPNFGEAYTNLGRALIEMGKTDEALEAFKKAIDINPDDELAHRNLVRVLEARGLAEGALIYQESIEQTP
jgi:superkiller protein 3